MAKIRTVLCVWYSGWVYLNRYIELESVKHMLNKVLNTLLVVLIVVSVAQMIFDVTEDIRREKLINFNFDKNNKWFTA